MLKGFDPMIIEPLLTGTTIYGEFDEKWGDIKSIEANEDTPDYLLHTAEIFYEWATKLAYQGNLRETLITLSFVQSYALYGFTYISNSNVVSLETIFKKQGGDIIKRIRHDAKSNQIIPNHQVNLAFNEVRKTLAELRMVLGYKSNP